MEILKENAALSGSCSSGAAPSQEQMNREVANGGSLLRMTVTSKIEETIMDLFREYGLNACAQQLHEQRIDKSWSSQPFLRRLLIYLEAECVVRKERGAGKRFKIGRLTRGAYSLRQFDFASGREISRQPLGKSSIADGSLRECLIKEEAAAATVNQLRSRVPQAAEKAS
ncbi:hypothetical protein [Parasutterella sp.]|uniref:hypothetical protein n=1 Tax=Parasutterella sp. TaxID=2049037 RepID=UPI003521B4F3